MKLLELETISAKQIILSRAPSATFPINNYPIANKLKKSIFNRSDFSDSLERKTKKFILEM